MENRKKLNREYFFALLALIATAGLGEVLVPLTGFRAVSFLFLLTIVFLSQFVSLGPILFSAVVSALLWNFFFIPPIFTFIIPGIEDISLYLSFLVTAVATGYLTHHLREKEAKAHTVDRLQQSEQLHQALLNSISHELRTPLTEIISAATSFKDPSIWNKTEFREELSADLTRSSRRLSRVIDNLLDMTRLNSGVLTLSKDWYDIPELLRLTANTIQFELSNHQIHFSGTEVSLTRVDYRLLEQAFGNLLINASHYAPKGSHIFVTVFEEEIQNKSFIAVKLRDQGPGIPENSLDRIFDKFYRAPGAKSGGTGLGLFIAKSFIEQHHGLIKVRNHTEGGAEFTIHLPIEKLPPPPSGDPL